MRRTFLEVCGLGMQQKKSQIKHAGSLQLYSSQLSPQLPDAGRTTHLIWNEQDDGGSLGRPGAHAHVLDERAELERRLDLAERDVLAHLKLDQVLPAVDDPESSVRHRLKVKNGAKIQTNEKNKIQTRDGAVKEVRK